MCWIASMIHGNVTLNIKENLINFSEKEQKIINKIYNLWLKRKKTEVKLRRKVKIFKDKK